MKKIIFIFFIMGLPVLLFSQIENNNNSTGVQNPFDKEEEGEKKEKKKDIYEVKKHRYADSMQVFKNFKLDEEISYLDTSLSIKSYYELNVLGRDIFGLQQLSNIGQPFSILTYQKTSFSSVPKMGFYGRDFYYKKSEDISYYDVKSPISEIRYRTTFEAGNILNALLTANITPNLNFSVSYTGVRSVGNYVGTYFSQFNFVATLNYKSDRYNFFSHFINQNVLGDENGGVKDVNEFIHGNSDYSTKSTVPINLSRNVNSFIRGQIYFLNHYFNVIKTDNFVLSLDHEFSFEDKYFSYKEPYDENSKNYYSSDFLINNLIYSDSTFYRNMNNDIGGKLTIFKSEFKVLLNINRIDYSFKSIKFFDNTLIENLPRSNNQFIKFQFKNTYFENITLFAKYIQGLNGEYSKSDLISLSGIFKLYEFKLEGNYQIINKYPDFTYFLFQSNYKNFNWKNNISQLENRQEIDVKFNYKNYNISASFNSIKNFYYFNENRVMEIYTKHIDLFSTKISVPIKFWKFGLENDFIYQKVFQGEEVYRLPDFVTRNTFYFETEMSFIGDKKVLFLQTGVTLNMFSSFLANAYNPLYSDYYLQNDQSVGGFPMLDVFINLKVRNMKIFLMAQHINNLLGSNKNYFSAPNQPYTDFTIRLGIIWNFFS